MKILYPAAAPTRAPFSLSIAVLLVCTFPLVALAQDTATIDTTPTTFMGWVWRGLLVLGGLAFTTLLVFITKSFASKANDGAVWSALNKLWLVVQASVAHGEAEIRPTLQAALADGKLDDEEKKKIKDLVLKHVWLTAGDVIGAVQKALGLSEAGANGLISGLIEKAVALMKGGGAGVFAPIAAALTPKPAPTAAPAGRARSSAVAPGATASAAEKPAAPTRP